jgi:hypothetical protein
MNQRKEIAMAMAKTRARHLCFAACFAVMMAAATACQPSDSGGTGTAGASGSAGSSGGNTTTGTAGTSGNAGSTGGSTGGGAIGGADATGTAGSAAGTGGSATGVAGRGGTTGAAGRGGTTGSAGTTGAAGSAGRGGTSGGGTGGSAAGTTGSAGAGAGDSYVSGVTVTVSTKVTTILVVTWTQAKAADQVFLEFSFAGSSVMTSRAVAGATGAHRDVVLGVPGSTAVTLRVVSRVAGTDYKTKDYTGTTGAVPSGMPKPTVSMFDATAATTDRYLLGAVENSPNTCTSDSCYFYSTWWLYIMDRQGRIVWYYSDGSTDVSSFPQTARDGEYLFVEKRAFSTTGTPSVIKMTLDRETYSASVMVPQLSDGVDMTSDGSLLYDTEERTRPNSELRQMTRAGTVTTIWKCPTTGFANCYSNVVSWDPATDTVLLSFPESNNIAQIDRKAGTLVATYGTGTGAYTFSPSPWNFVWQHYANISPQGTLLVSSHLPQYTKDSAAGPSQHAFEEFMIDRTNKRLTRVWIFGDAAADGPEWAASRGEAVRLKNGNTLVNYGTGGVIREVTPAKKTVFYVKWDISSTNDYFNKLVGHNFMIDDLYALNGGGPK